MVVGCVVSHIRPLFVSCKLKRWQKKETLIFCIVQLFFALSLLSDWYRTVCTISAFSQKKPTLCREFSLEQQSKTNKLFKWIVFFLHPSSVFYVVLFVKWWNYCIYVSFCLFFIFFKCSSWFLSIHIKSFRIFVWEKNACFAVVASYYALSFFQCST